jgi:hypothetical protein
MRDIRHPGFPGVPTIGNIGWFRRFSIRAQKKGGVSNEHTSCAGAYDSGFVGPRLHDVATGGPGGVGDSFVLLPRILGCWGGSFAFARAFLPGRLVYSTSTHAGRGRLEEVVAVATFGTLIMKGSPSSLV